MEIELVEEANNPMRAEPDDASDAAAPRDASEDVEDAGDASPQIATLRGLILPIYAPGILYAIARSVGFPLVPILARRTLGIDDRSLGLALAAQGVGKVVTNAWAGALQRRVGDKGVSLCGGVATCLACLGLGVCRDFAGLCAAEVALGAAMSLMQIGRQSWMRVSVMDDLRGRAMAQLGAWVRVANVVGPLMGGAVASKLDARAGLLIASIFAALGTLATFFGMRGDAFAKDESQEEDSLCGAYAEVCSKHGGALASTATFGFFMFTLRNARQLLLPLAALELGAGPAVVSGCVAASFVTDAAVGMTVAGALMDRCGRKPAGFAATALLAAGFAALAAALFDGTRPKTHALVFVHVAAAVIGAGNGCSSGLVMAMSTDVAPAALRGPFLGLFRVFSDAGIVVGSAAVGSLADAADVEAAASATAMAALATLGVLYCCVAETRPGARRKRRGSTAGKPYAMLDVSDDDDFDDDDEFGGAFEPDDDDDDTPGLVAPEDPPDPDRAEEEA